MRINSSFTPERVRSRSGWLKQHIIVRAFIVHKLHNNLPSMLTLLDAKYCNITVGTPSTLSRCRVVHIVKRQHRQSNVSTAACLHSPVLSWLICTVLSHLYCLESPVLSWVTCTVLSHMYCLESHVLSWVTCTVFTHLYCLESPVLSWVTCTVFTHLYCLESHVLSWVTCTVFTHLYCLESPVLSSLTCTFLSHLYFINMYPDFLSISYSSPLDSLPLILPVITNYSIRSLHITCPRSPAAACEVFPTIDIQPV